MSNYLENASYREGMDRTDRSGHGGNYGYGDNYGRGDRNRERERERERERDRYGDRRDRDRYDDRYVNKRRESRSSRPLESRLPEWLRGKGLELYIKLIKIQDLEWVFMRREIKREKRVEISLRNIEREMNRRFDIVDRSVEATKKIQETLDKEKEKLEKEYKEDQDEKKEKFESEMQELRVELQKVWQEKQTPKKLRKPASDLNAIQTRLESRESECIEQSESSEWRQKAEQDMNAMLEGGRKRELYLMEKAFKRERGSEYNNFLKNSRKQVYALLKLKEEHKKAKAKMKKELETSRESRERKLMQDLEQRRASPSEREEAKADLKMEIMCSDYKKRKKMREEHKKEVKQEESKGDQIEIKYRIEDTKICEKHAKKLKDHESQYGAWRKKQEEKFKKDLDEIHIKWEEELREDMDELERKWAERNL